MSGGIRVRLPDGSVRELPFGATGLDLARSLGEGLARAAVGVLVDGRIEDLRAPLPDGAEVRILTARDEEALEVLRHSAAHAMAQAVTRLFPGAKLAIGPTVKDGFYYDIALDRPLREEDLERIEQEMAQIVREDLPIERFELDRPEALEWARSTGQTFKEELIAEIPEDEAISFYRQGEFTDLCSGPHVQRTGQLGKAFKLLKVAGAYWRGDEEREQLQRIYGTAWFDRKALAAYLARLEEARKRDHRKIGRDLDLFSFHEEAPAMPFFHPKGALVRNLLVDYVRGLYRERGYEEVITPQILDVSLWERSGHLANYKENMYFARGGAEEPGGTDREPEAAVKPMNCPTHCLIYGTRKRSYRDLPIRYADFGRLHRFERSGVTAGLLRVRSFSQDDAHIFCTPEQIEQEVRGVTDMILECYRTFRFDEVRIYLSTKPDKSIGDPALWERAEKALAGALDSMGVSYRVQPGEGAFYGPKIDFVVLDALEREWQLGTCQLDFNLPERFGLRYTSPEGAEERPVMIHRAMLGSLERFLGVLLEHTAGDLPLFLAPEQARVLSITDAQADRAREVAAVLRERGFRASADVRSEKIGAKVREASVAKVRYQLIIGAREAERGTVSVRHRTQGDLGEQDLDAFCERLSREVAAFE